MDIRQLKYFITIVDCGSVTAAAKQLNMSQPPLSTQLKLLEDELGVTLFSRINNRLQLTEEGLLLYHQARSVVSHFNSTCHMFDRSNHGICGTLKLGSVCSSSIFLIPQILGQYLIENPNVHVRFCEGNSEWLTRQLDNGAIDFCIVKEPMDRNSFTSLPLHFFNNDEANQLVAVALPSRFSSLGNTINVSDLKDQPLLIQSPHIPTLINLCRSYSFEPNLIHMTSSILTIFVWCLRNIGIAIIPSGSVHLLSLLKDGAKLVVKTINDCSFDSNAVLTWKKDYYLNPAAFRFIELIKQIAISSE